MNLRGIWQAAYTAGVVLPKPVATAQYWHRSLNPKKLISVGFSRLAVSLLCSRLLARNQWGSSSHTTLPNAVFTAEHTRCSRLLVASSQEILADLQQRSRLLLWYLDRVAKLRFWMMAAQKWKLPSSPDQGFQLILCKHICKSACHCLLQSQCWCWGAASHDAGADAEALQAARSATDAWPAAAHSTGRATGGLLNPIGAHMTDVSRVWPRNLCCAGVVSMS